MSSIFGTTPSIVVTQPASGDGNKPNPGASSLFGSLSSNATPQPQFFSSTNSNADGTNPNGSIFNHGILPLQGSVNSVARGPNGEAPQPAYFQNLLDKAPHKRGADDRGGLPQLHYGLQDISRKVRNIGQGGPSSGLGRGTTDSPRGLSGISLGQSVRNIDLFASSRQPVSTPEDALDTSMAAGVKSDLGQHHRTNFEKLIADRLQQAQKEFDEMIYQQLHDVDWRAQRQRIYEHFGLKKPSGGVASSVSGDSLRRSKGLGGSELGKSYGLAGWSKSVIGTPTVRGGIQSTFNDVEEKLPVDGLRPAVESRVQRKKQDDYAVKVKELNVARIQDSCYPVLAQFAEVEGASTSEDNNMLINAYRALICITGEDGSKTRPSDPGAIRERQYAQDYLDDNAAGKAQRAIRTRIINGSRTFMEQHYLTQLEQTVAKYPREAQIGGIPDVIGKIKGYVKVRIARKELGPDLDLLQELGGDYCWAVVFYCIRCGLVGEALRYVESNAAAFKAIDRNFARYLRAFVNSPHNRLPADMQRLIDNEYSTRMRIAPENSLDPFRMICYKIIGRCEINRRSLDNITNDMMDWLWLQFVLAREYQRVDEMANEAFGLEEIRTEIKQIGEKFFGPGSEIPNAPNTFFFMQIVAGLFEKAVADLYPHNYVSATHFAIVLDYYGLLRVNGDANAEDLLSQTVRSQPQIAFGPLVGRYTGDFRTADATAAVDYICLICLNADLVGEIGRGQRDMCYQALREVVLETREYAQLLGDIRSDGRRIEGAIEQRLKLIKLENERDFLKTITVEAARVAQEQSRTTDAALLYHLAEDYDMVIQVINDAVSIALTTELGHSPARIAPLKPRVTQHEDTVPGSSLSLTAVDDPIVLAKNMNSLYSTSSMYMDKISRFTIDASNVLLNLASARASFEAGDWPACIEFITSSHLLPTDANGNMTVIRSRAQTFSQVPSVISRVIGPVILWAVKSCVNQADRMRNAEFETGAQHEMISQCKRIAEDVYLWAGLIRFKLPGRIWDALAEAGEGFGN
ncbi:NIC-domain-containing protein [Piedraia hortae CBS 480.64]|uniref:NIC-domain-containing protein n=1 Tax=Piedraia hortae CBS 480.64 TaxID=1314780 RepID=A0A6A7BYZ6_9PEZI|nr:NIC-domain-containing protein [Piedraia hortae CBS 480.64]